MLRRARLYFWLHTQESLVADVRGPCGMPELKLRSAAFKTILSLSTCYTILSLQALDIRFLMRKRIQGDNSLIFPSVFLNVES